MTLIREDGTIVKYNDPDYHKYYMREYRKSKQFDTTGTIPFTDPLLQQIDKNKLMEIRDEMKLKRCSKHNLKYIEELIKK